MTVSEVLDALERVEGAAFRHGFASGQKKEPAARGYAQERVECRSEFIARLRELLKKPRMDG